MFPCRNHGERRIAVRKNIEIGRTFFKIMHCRCLGSTQHLKNLYGAGYTLEVKLKHIEFQQATINDSSSASSSSDQPHQSIHHQAFTVSGSPLATPPTPIAILQHTDPLMHLMADRTTNSTTGAISTHSVESVASSCPLNRNSSEPPAAPSKHQQLPAQPTSFDVACDERQERRSAALRQFVVDLFPDASLEESFADRLVYSVPQHAVSSLAECFHQLERGKPARVQISQICLIENKSRQKYIR